LPPSFSRHVWILNFLWRITGEIHLVQPKATNDGFVVQGGGLTETENLTAEQMLGGECERMNARLAAADDDAGLSTDELIARFIVFKLSRFASVTSEDLRQTVTTIATRRYSDTLRCCDKVQQTPTIIAISYTVCCIFKPTGIIMFSCSKIILIFTVFLWGIETESGIYKFASICYAAVFLI